MKVKLKDICEEIHTYLKKFEGDSVINAAAESRLNAGAIGLTPYYNSCCYASGNRCMIVYISYQGAHSLTKTKALAYLEWLRKGNTDKHFMVKTLSQNT